MVTVSTRVLGFALGAVAWADAAAAWAAPPETEKLRGVVTYEDGKPAPGATIEVAESKSGRLRQVVTTDRAGRYEVALEAGEYALAIVTSDGFAFIPKQRLPDSMAWSVLKQDCYRLTGRITPVTRSTRVLLARQSFDTGDTFIAPLDRDGNFVMCMPAGQYKSSVEGDTLAPQMTIDLNGPSSIPLTSYPRSHVEASPPISARIVATLPALVESIRASHADIIGLGEATHGTGELYRYREQLTLELVRQLDVRLLLFEMDALASVPLDRFINGEDINLDNAIDDLGVWITNTVEFRTLLNDLRAYNRTATRKLHLRGVDVQNTTPPVKHLIEAADELGMSPAQRDIVKRMGNRGKAVRELSGTQRADLDALLARIGSLPGNSERQFLHALAAKSLAIQLRYWVEDSGTWYRKNRDMGMAELTRFIVSRSNSRAVLWAHSSHLSKESNEPMLGRHLADGGGYYVIGFYLYQGSTRAWDEASAIGIIPHEIPSAPPFTVEGALMRAAGIPEVAWIALSRLPPSLAAWLRIPRYVREVYATFRGNDAMMRLRNIAAGFDAFAIVRTGHDSTPVATAGSAH